LWVFSWRQFCCCLGCGVCCVLLLCNKLYDNYKRRIIISLIQVILMHYIGDNKNRHHLALSQ
jgi:uncharacterized membrane protein